MARGEAVAADVVDAARFAGLTVACGESLTGGAVCDALVSVPGASDVVRGGVVAYHRDLKSRVLGVEPGLIDEHGVVSEPVARAMADGVRHVMGATLGVGTTGVAGPEAHDGVAPGTACVAVVGLDVAWSRTIRVEGSRDAVRDAAVAAALAGLHEAITRSSAHR
ncbi:CinA family protein [uncultured Demequina sp.]|uniref:CinA family protein n=1 Tax=uncultured Demequina sp. TaxID=693499 RepID=UPI0025D62368|nr:CinA family protein [uncultured Demequina sp.]